MAQLNVTLLGGFQARLGSGPVLRLRARRTQALLAYLALPCGRAHSRDTLSALLWGHLAQEEARSRLRQALFTLRRTFTDAQLSCLTIDGDTLALDPAGVEVDALLFEELIREGSADALERAAMLYRGDLLQGLPSQGPIRSTFEEWLGEERERLRDLAIEALAELVNIQRAGGSPERALATTMRLLALDPLQEAAHRMAMRLHVQLWRRTAALRQYQVCVSLLRKELNIEPEEETRQLYRDILRRQVIATPTERHPRPVEGPEHGPLIGREVERDRLRSWLAKVFAGSCQIGLLVGEAGAGKSRLVATLVAAARAADAKLGSGVRVLLGRCNEGEQILALGPWIDVFRGARLSEDRSVLDRLGPVWRAELTRLLPEFGAPELPALLEPPDATRLFEAVRQLVLCFIHRDPVVLILEDLHWADEMSLHLLQFLVRRTPRGPLLIVGTLREEEVPDLPLLSQILERLEGEPHVDCLHVAPLSRRATLQLVRALSSTTSEPGLLERVGQEVWRVSEGNPFVIVETMRARQQGITLRGPGGLVLTDQVRRIILRRLDRLSPVARHLAALGAVIGRRFEFNLLLGAARLDEGITADGVEELVRRQVLHEAEGGLDFVHDRVRGTVYGELLSPRRRLLHRQVAEALEVLHAGDLDPHLLALGIHYREGEVWDKAVAYMVRAGLSAAVRSAHREAVASFEESLRALTHLPDIQGTWQQAVEIRLHLRNSLWPLGEFEKLLLYLHEAEGFARTLDDPRPLGWVSAYLSTYLWLSGHSAQARAFGQNAHASALKLGDRSLQVVATTYLGLSDLTSGDYSQAEECFREVVEALAGGLEHERCNLPFFPVPYCHALWAWALAGRGVFDESIAHGRQSVRIAAELDHPFTQVAVTLAVASAYGARGEFGHGARLLERGLALCREFEFRGPIASLTAGLLGHMYAFSEHVGEGLSLLEDALRSMTPTGAGAWHSLVIVALGEAYAIAGRLEDAGPLATQALTLTRERGQRGWEARTLRLLGELACRADSPDVAHGHYRQALALGETLGMLPLVAHCHLGLGKLYRRTGNRDQAHEHLTTATTLYREMDMRFYLEQAEMAMTRLA